MHMRTYISVNSHYTHTLKTYTLIANAGEDAEKRDSLYIGGENVNKTSH